MIEIIPSLLVESKKEFERKLRLVEPHCKTVHVDILDGTLFENTTWFDAEAVGALRTDVRYELHLMVENPLPIIEQWKRYVAQTHRAIVHAEIHRPLPTVIGRIKDQLHLEAGVALNPETPLSEAHEVMHLIDQLTVMGVHTGSSGQPFLGDMILEKIRLARNHRPDLAIEVDGGVTTELLSPLLAAGATRLCAASAVFSADNPVKSLQQLIAKASTDAI